MFGSVQAFPMYDGLGMSTPSPHRESLMNFTLVSLIFSSHSRLASYTIYSAFDKHKMATKTSGNAGTTGYR